MWSRCPMFDEVNYPWTPRTVRRQPAPATEPEQEKCAEKRAEDSWLPKILKALDAFPEAQQVVRHTILVLCGYATNEASP